MPELQIFENEAFGQIRVLEMDGEPWFVAADVCRALELDDVGKATTRLDEDELTRIKIWSGGQNREMIAVNEPGLYALVLGSRKPEAKAFKRWITHEVLPALRKTGSYSLLSVSSQVEQRVLTTDDYLKAALIVANCRNERLPYVLGFLEKGGWDIPKVKSAPSARVPLSVLITRTMNENNLTLKQLEDLTGLSCSAMCRYKNSKRNPRPETYDYIVKILNGITRQE